MLLAVARVRLDRDGMGRMLRSAPVRGAIYGLATAAGENARRQGHTVDDINISGRAVTTPLAEYVQVSTYTTDRAAAAVTLAHPAGIGMQAVHGVLTIAATSVGLDVNKG